MAMKLKMQKKEQIIKYVFARLLQVVEKQMALRGKVERWDIQLQRYHMTVGHLTSYTPLLTQNIGPTGILVE